MAWMEWTSARTLTDAVVAPFHSKANMSEGGSILSKPARLLIRMCVDAPVMQLKSFGSLLHAGCDARSRGTPPA